MIAVAGKRRNNPVYMQKRVYSNTYDQTAAQCFSLAHHNDWSRWFAISSPQFMCCPSFSLMGGGCKNNKQLNFGYEKYFGRFTYYEPLEML